VGFRIQGFRLWRICYFGMDVIDKEGGVDFVFCFSRSLKFLRV
jgi:hypothetical protein